jgi:hypothetical protein
MSIKIINVGNAVNDGSGDDLRSAFVKVNDNFNELNNRQGQNNTASNLIGGIGLFKEKVGADLRFKSIAAGPGISLASNNTTIVIASNTQDFDLGPIIPNDIDENTDFVGWLRETMIMDMGSFEDPTMSAGGSGSGGGGNGYTGSVGETGYRGSIGASGYRGSIGDAGYRGSVGDIGPVGYKGSLGSPGIGGAGTSRSTVTFTTTSLSVGSNYNYDLEGFKGYVLLGIQTDNYAWVTVYSNSAARTTDASRPIFSDPIPGRGILAEAINLGASTLNLTPAIFGYSAENPPTTIIPVRVNNNGPVTAAITVTLTLIQLELS